MQRWRAVVKRAFDLMFSTIVLLVLSPLLAAVAILVKTSSAGPVFYRQQRVGKDGNLFWLYKFRSMRLNTSNLAVTAGDDPRITNVGKWLRKTKLDELPQFVNVLFGHMSIVGPRPEVPNYVERYTDLQRRVHSRVEHRAGAGVRVEQCDVGGGEGVTPLGDLGYLPEPEG